MPAQPSTIASAPSSALARVDLRRSFSRAPGRRIFEREHRNLAGAHARAAAIEAVFHQIGLDRRDRARKRRHDAEAMRDQRGQMKRRLADADDRAAARRSARPRARCRRNRR